jgi:hypothetical protein
LMNCQMIRVISSPSISTTGVATLILAMTAPRERLAASSHRVVSTDYPPHPAEM